MHTQTALGETTDMLQVSVMPAMTLDGVMYIRAMEDPSKSPFRDSTYKIGYNYIKKINGGHFKTKSFTDHFHSELFYPLDKSTISYG